MFLRPIDVGRSQIDLIDRNHDFDLGRCLGVIDRFDCLRHQPVIGRDYQDHDVRDRRATRTHGGKCGVTRSIEKSNGLAFIFHAIRPDVLRDSAGFARSHSRFPDCIHQRSLPVIDVSHECDDGRAGFELFLLRRLRRRGSNDDLFFLVNAASFFAPFFFQNKSVPLRNLRRDIRFNCLVGVYENVEVIHQLLDQLEIFHPELRRQFLDDDRRFDGDDVLRFFFDRRCDFGGRLTVG